MAKLECLIEKPLSGEWGLDDENGTGIPVLRTTNFTNEGVINYEKIVTRIISSSKLKDKFLRYGDIILEKSGGSEKQPVGRVVFFEGENDRYLFNNFTTVLRVRDTSVINSKYLFYVLFYNYFSGGTKKFQSKTTGLHNLHLTNFIKSVDIPLVSLSQQVKIVKKFDTINNSRAKRKLQLSKLDQLVKARFVEMFGDPVKNSAKWPQGPLSSCLFSIENGKSFVCSANPRKENRPAVLKLSAVTYGKYDYKENKELLEENMFVEKAEVHSGDLLFTRKNTPELVGMCAYVFETPPRLMMPDLIFRLNTNKNCNKIFLCQLINHELFRNNITAIAGGSAKSMSNISKERLKQLEIILPPFSLQEEFASFVQQVEKSKAAVKQSLEKLETLKKSLMQEYFG